MFEHHRRTIDRLTKRFESDPNYLALLIGGSIAKGREKEDSDVDFMLISTPEECVRRAQTGNYQYYATDLCDYPGGYVDGKVVDLAFLREVADHGSEPARSAFAGALTAFSRLPELGEVLARIPVYQESEYAEKATSFCALVEGLRWFIPEAEKRDDRYLLLHAASDLALFGGRLILAHNRILYPYHKWFTWELERAPRKPEGFMAGFHALLSQPGRATAEPFCEAVLSYADWPRSPHGWPSRFIEDNEWNWRGRKPPIEDW